MSTISLRLPDSLHERARELAKKENISMAEQTHGACGVAGTREWVD